MGITDVVAGLMERTLIESTRLSSGVALVCGAGLASSVEGLPDSAHLTHALLAETSAPAHPDTTLATAATRFEREHDRRRLLSFFAKHVDDPSVAPSRLHRLIAALPFGVILTTNWDRLLEHALQDQHKRFITTIPGGQMPYWDPKQASAVLLVKLFGSIEQPESLIATEQDRASFPQRLLSVARMLESSASLRTLLFVGFDLRNPNFRQLFEDTNRALVLERYQIFFVQQPPMAPAEAETLGYGMQVLVAPLDAFLQELVDRTGASVRPTQGKYNYTLQQTPILPETFLSPDFTQASNAGRDTTKGFDLSREDLERQADRHRRRLERLQAQRANPEEAGASLALENEIQRTTAEISALEREIRRA